MPPSLRAERSSPVGATLRRVALPWGASLRVMTGGLDPPKASTSHRIRCGRVPRVKSDACYPLTRSARGKFFPPLFRAAKA